MSWIIYIYSSKEVLENDDNGPRCWKSRAIFACWRLWLYSFRINDPDSGCVVATHNESWTTITMASYLQELMDRTWTFCEIALSILLGTWNQRCQSYYLYDYFRYGFCHDKWWPQFYCTCDDGDTFLWCEASYAAYVHGNTFIGRFEGLWSSDQCCARR